MARLRDSGGGTAPPRRDRVRGAACGWALAGILLLAPGPVAAGASSVADAAQAMDIDAVRALVADAADVNAPQADGMTALHWASLRDADDLARLLVRSDADANAANRYGVTPLALACTNGNETIVRLLLDAGADPNATLPGGETALMTASRTGRLGAVQALLEHGADIAGRVHGMGRREGAGANAFLSRMRDPNNFDFETKPEQSALLWAVAEGHAEVVRELIAAGADFRAALSSGMTPLVLAARNGHLEVARALVEAGADVKRRVEPEPKWRLIGYSAKLRPGATALHVAVENGSFELAAFLLDAGADPNASDPSGYAALHAIATARRVPPGDADPPPDQTGSLTSLDMVRDLAAHGADLNARMTGPGLVNLGSPVFGPTAFLGAAQTADLELMRVLADLGADPGLRDGIGRTALMLVGSRTGTDAEVLEAIELLIGLGVDVGAVDRHGETVLHAAAYRDRAAPIRLLASKSTDSEIWNKENRYGLTPLAIAMGYRGPRSFRPQPAAEAAIREAMIAAGLEPPEDFVVASAPTSY